MVSLEHAYGIACILAALTFLFAAKGSKPHELLTLLIGALMIGLAAIAAATFSDFLVIAQLLDVKNRSTSHGLENVSRINNLWVLTFPAFVGAAGVNLLTSWIQARKPASDQQWEEVGADRINSVDSRLEPQPAISTDRAVSDQKPARMRGYSRTRRARLVRKR